MALLSAHATPRCLAACRMHLPPPNPLPNPPHPFLRSPDRGHLHGQVRVRGGSDQGGGRPEGGLAGWGVGDGNVGEGEGNYEPGKGRPVKKGVEVNLGWGAGVRRCTLWQIWRGVG